jgi:hypothetical protein
MQAAPVLRARVGWRLRRSDAAAAGVGHCLMRGRAASGRWCGFGVDVHQWQKFLRGAHEGGADAPSVYRPVCFHPSDMLDCCSIGGFQMASQHHVTDYSIF